MKCSFSADGERRGYFEGIPRRCCGYFEVVVVYYFLPIHLLKQEKAFVQKALFQSILATEAIYTLTQSRSPNFPKTPNTIHYIVRSRESKSKAAMLLCLSFNAHQPSYFGRRGGFPAETKEIHNVAFIEILYERRQFWGVSIERLHDVSHVTSYHRLFIGICVEITILKAHSAEKYSSQAFKEISVIFAMQPLIHG